MVFPHRQFKPFDQVEEFSETTQHMSNPSLPQRLETEHLAPGVLKVIPSLRNNFVWTLAGNVIYGACQWTMLSVLAKMGSASIVGQFTLGLAVGAPIFMFTNLQLRQVQATDVSAETGFANYFTLRMFLTLFGLLVVLEVLPFISSSSTVRLVVFLVAVSKSIECVSDVTAGLLQREEQLKRVAISLMIRGLASTLIFSMIFAYFRNLSYAVTGMCGVWLAVLLLYDLPNVRRLIGPRYSLFQSDWRSLWQLTMLGLPLGWVVFFGSLNVNIPRYFLQHDLGLAEQGIYASLAYLIVAINLIVSALSASVTTHLARLFANNERKRFVHLMIKLCLLGALITIVGVPLSFIIGQPLLTILYSREYADHVGLLAIFVAVTGLTTIGNFFFSGLTAARSFQVQVPIYFAQLVIGVTGTALLVPRYGMIGAGIGLFLSTLIMVLGGGWALYRVVYGVSPREG